MNNASQNDDAPENPFEEEEFSDDEDREITEEENVPYDIPSKDRKLVTHPYDFIVRSLNDQIITSGARRVTNTPTFRSGMK